jgi:hypothetical protein
MAEEKEKPALRIASEQTDQELAKQRALEDLSWPARQMVANMLRVMRGAGRPYDLPEQVVDLAIAIQAAGRHTNAWYIGQALSELLTSALPRREYAEDFDNFERTIAQGSLQLLASTLLGHIPQKAAGSREIFEGIRERERYIERMHAKVEEERAAEALARAKRVLSRRTKKKARVRSASPPRPQPVKPAEIVEEVPAPTSTAEAMRRRAKELSGER